MADELLQAGILEGMTWRWNANLAKNFFSAGCLSPSPYCSSAIGGEGLGAMWPVGDCQIMINNMGVVDSGTTKSFNDFLDDPDPVRMLDSSTLQAMGFGNTAWNHDIIHGGSRDHGDYNMLQMQADVNSYGQHGGMNPTAVFQAGGWSTTCGGGGSGKDFNCSSSPPAAVNSAGNSSGTEGSTVTGDGQITVASSFPVDSSPLFPSFHKEDFGIKCSSDHQILPSNWSDNQVLGSSFAQQRQQQIINDIRETLLGVSPSSSSPPSPQSQPRKISNSKVNKNEGGCDMGSVGSRNGGEPLIKRRRIETPSSLPTFKVRKEKLGDRITALQQLVSPFGKTDTASVLHEAIEYIKFLHDQVNVLSTPYMKNGAPIQQHHQQESKPEGEGPKQDLRSRGLCLVPISSTFPVAHETPADFWTPTFGASFR